MLLVAGRAEATEIVVTTVSDASNGETSSAAALLQSPGPDGVSLREAIEAANADRGGTIRFARALRGRAIVVEGLPALAGGNLTIDGDVDGDGDADVTLRPARRDLDAFAVVSSGNRLHALRLEGFTTGVAVSAPSLAPRRTISGTVLTNLVMRGIRYSGITFTSLHGPRCGAPRRARCATHHRWTNATVRGNDIEAGIYGFEALPLNVGDAFEHATVTDNRFRILGPDVDAAVALTTGGDSLRARIADVLVARNSIEGTAGIGINVNAGANRGHQGLVEDVRILDNRLTRDFCCAGIWVQAGSETVEHTTEVRPPRYQDGNTVRNVVVRGNRIDGDLRGSFGVIVVAGMGAGGRGNRVEDVRVEGNLIRSGTAANGVLLLTGKGVSRRRATGNRLTRVTVARNRIELGRAGPGAHRAEHLRGIAIVGGDQWARGNSIRDVTIAGNRIAGARIGIHVVGGTGATGPSSGNRVSCVRLTGNRIAGAPEAVAVAPNIRGASGNRAGLAGC